MKKLLLILLCLPLLYSCGDKEKIKKLEDRITELEKKENIDNGSFSKEISNKNKVVENEVVENEVVEKVVEKIEQKVEVNKQTVNPSLKHYLYSGKEKQKKSSKGDKNGEIDGIGEEGNGDRNTHGEGSPNSQLLIGRELTYTPQPKGDNEEVGIVAVEITVDRLGNVIHAIAGVGGSTTVSPVLYQSAKKAALETKFEAKESAPLYQQGKIIYHFNYK